MGKFLHGRVPVLPSRVKAVVCARAGFSNLRSPFPVECLLIRVISNGGGIDRRPKETGSICLAGGGASRSVPTQGEFLSASRCGASHGTKKPGLSDHAGQHEGLPASPGFHNTHRAGPPATMTQVTPCQTQHNIPASRETVGAAVHAAVKIATNNNRMTAVAANVAPARAASAPRSSARKARARRVAASR